MAVLPLDSPRWKSLSQAYGSAEIVPALLRRLSEKTEPDESSESEPWFTIWSSLCHQEDVYDGSYAAVPHVVAIALASTTLVSFDFFLFPASIEVSRHRGRGPAIPPDLQPAYSAALGDLHELAFRQSRFDWDDAMALSVASALAAAKGRIDVAEAVFLLESDVIRRLIAGDF